MTNIADYGAAGPHDNWPIGKGFNRWYGFHGALTDQWNPELCQDNRPIQLEKTDDYHLSTDLVDHAITDIKDHISSAQGRPFFLYLAFGACHWLITSPRSTSSATRQVRLRLGRHSRPAAQEAAGIGRRAPRHGACAAQSWGPSMGGVSRGRAHAIGAPSRNLCGFPGAHGRSGRQARRSPGSHRPTGQYADRIAFRQRRKPEGGPTGAINLRKHMVYETESPQVGIAHLDKIGSELAYNHYPTGWAQVSNTPLKWYKKNVHGGGVRAPLIIHWPGHIADPGVLRHQYHHVIDIAPTLYEIMNIEVPGQYKGVSQLPVHGVGMNYTFADVQAPTKKDSQIFELLGDRAIWHQGWKAVSRHPKGRDFDLDQWELYHLSEDFSEACDLAKQHPQKLEELVALWWEQAGRYGVLPLDDRDWERAAERLKMNQTLRYEFHSNMARVDRMQSPDITDRSYAVEARFTVGDEPPRGVLLAWGSHFGGFVIYLKDGRLCYEYVYSESLTHRIEGPYQPPPGDAKVELHFIRTGKNAGRAVLLADGNEIGEVEIPKTWPTHGTTAGLNCGQDAGAPVSFSYQKPFRFNAGGLKVTVNLATDSESEAGAAYAAA